MRVLIFSLLLTACSSAPPAPPLPDWTKSPAREVENGYIIFVAEADDHSADRAMTKAEGVALQDLANECSLIPLGARLEDRARRREGALNEAYAKVAVEFETCEDAKRARTPEAIRKIANVAMTEQLKRYQDLGDEPAEVKPLVASSSGQAAPTPGATPPPLASGFQYYVVRQDIAYEKQAVILAPPTAYAPGTPEVTHFNQAMLRTDQVATYEAAHPTERGQVWSQYRGRAASELRQMHFDHAREMRSPRAGAPRAPAPPPRRGRRHGR